MEEAPAGFTPSAIETGDPIPGQVFAGQNRVKVVPNVSAISAGVAEGMLLHKIAPVYPEFAKAAHVSGTVLLGATITKSGTIVETPRDQRASNSESSRRRRGQKLAHRPYLLNNQPVEVQTTY